MREISFDTVLTWAGFLVSSPPQPERFGTPQQPAGLTSLESEQLGDPRAGAMHEVISRHGLTSHHASIQ